MNNRAELISQIESHARSIRRKIIKMLEHSGSGHSAGSLGLVDIIACLYFEVLNYNKRDPKDSNRDLFLLSNGHVCPVLYATLDEVGVLDKDEYLTLRQFSSRLQGHPERIKLPWLESTSGPLGEGLSIAGGMAYGLKYLEPSNNRRVYVVMGDGELNEGQCWEAALFAGKYRLDNITVIVDYNHIQLSGDTKDIMPMNHLKQMWESCGWSVISLPREKANDIESILDTFMASRAMADKLQKPVVILAETVPGRGVDFMEDDYRWHGQAPTKDQAKLALKELSEGSPQ